MQVKVNGSLDGLTRKVKKGIETVSFKISIPSPKDWDRLKEFSDQDVAVEISVRQSSLKLTKPPAEA